MLRKIISGGQTGADIAGLRAAARCGLKTGGSAPQYWMTERGENEKELRSFGLVEHHKPGYRTRTVQNIRDSDATLLIARSPLTGGSKLTREKVFHAKKLLYHLEPTPLGWSLLRDVVRWLDLIKPGVLNIAGNRESVCPGIEKSTEEFLVLVFQRLYK